MTRPEVEDLILFLSAAYPRWQVSEATIDAYTIGLDDSNPALILKAARHHQKVSQWPPTVAELRTLAQEYAPGPKRPTADEAWEEFRRAWKAASSFDPAPAADTWTTPLIHVAAKRIPSWHALRQFSTEDFRWVQRDFCAAYREAAECEKRGDVVASVEALSLPQSLVQGIGR